MPPLYALMYLTASSAAWRYSGKVTAPVSSLIRPTLIGEPVAAFGVPRAAADASAWVEVVDNAGHFPWYDVPGSVRHALERLLGSAS